MDWDRRAQQEPSKEPAARRRGAALAPFHRCHSDPQVRQRRNLYSCSGCRQMCPAGSLACSSPREAHWSIPSTWKRFIKHGRRNAGTVQWTLVQCLLEAAPVVEPSLHKVPLDQVHVTLAGSTFAVQSAGSVAAFCRLWKNQELTLHTHLFQMSFLD